MSKQANPTLIGAFVVGATALLLAALLVFGGSKLFSEQRRFTLFFAESVNGLNVGAPVKMRGVQVGKVTEIVVRYEPRSRSLLTPVVIEVETDRIQMITDTTFPWQGPTLDNLINYGLRAQLRLQSLVTGQLYVDLDFYPDTPVKLVGLSKDYDEIPVISSSQKEIESTVTELVREVRELPLKQMFTKLDSTLTHIDEVVSQPELKQSVQRLDHVLANLEQVTGGLNRQIKEISNNLNENLELSQTLVKSLNQALPPLLESSQHTLDLTDETLHSITDTLGPNSLLVTHLYSTLDALHDSTREFRVLSEMLQTHPEVLLKGKQP